MTAGRTPDLLRAARALATLARAGDDRLAAMPPRSSRSEAEQALADGIHRECRAARSRLMREHGNEVYDELTSARREPLFLAELADRAAQVFPGLVPTREMIAAERQLPQRLKEGREIDQGIFFGGLLRRELSGTHLIEAARAPTATARKLLSHFQLNGKVVLQTVTVERRAGVAYVTVHNNLCLNAEDDQLGDDMETAVDLVLLDEGVLVGVVRGGVMDHPKYHGRRVFSAGINLTDLYNGQISFVGFVLGREFGYLSKIMRGLCLFEEQAVLEKPWIAAVDTFAIGGGMQLLLAFDRLLAEERAYFSLPAVQEGIVPGAANLRLGRRLGAGLTRQLILGGRRLSATDPEAGGLCDSVLPSESLDDAIAASAEQLTAPAVIANRRMLLLAEEPVSLFREYMATFAQLQAERLYSTDVLDSVEREWLRRRR